MISNYALVGLSILGALLAGCSTGAAEKAGFTETAFNFGDVRQGDLLEHRFELRNPSSSPVKIQVVNLSHPGMKIRAAKEAPPGGGVPIGVTWDTRSVKGNSEAIALVRLDEREEVSLNLSAKVIPPIDILPYPAVFISAFRGEPVTRTLEIVNNESSALNITGLKEAEGVSRISADLKTVEAGRRYQIDVRIKPDAHTGQSEHTLNVLTDHPRFAVINLPVNVLVKGDVYINPDSVDFGDITLAADPVETFFLKTRNGGIRILSVESDLSYLKVTHSANEQFSSHQFVVEFQGKPIKTGPIKGTIRIKTDDARFPEFIVRVRGELH